jgi:hypothetical protein
VKPSQEEEGMNAEGQTGSGAAPEQNRGHARRAVMLGAAAVGAGAVAGVAAPATAALASSQSAAQKTSLLAPARRVVVRLPAKPLNIDQAMNVVQNVLNQSGCQGCFSGLDLIFTYENEFIVNAKGEVETEL